MNRLTGASKVSGILVESSFAKNTEELKFCCQEPSQLPPGFL
jgi:hypothetical protein